MEKRIKHLTLIFVASWIGIVVLSVFCLSLKIQNLWLNDVIKNSEYSFAATSELLNEYKNSRLNEAISGQKAVAYFEWQYVLKDQVKFAAKRLHDSIKSVSKEKNKAALAGLLHYNLGLNYMMVLDFNNAAKSFQAALKYDALDTQSYYNLALIYSVYFKNPRQAVAYYHQCLKIIPEGAQKELIKQRINELNNPTKN